MFGSCDESERNSGQAGRAYAFMIEMTDQTTAANVIATFYQAGAAAGSAGFEPVVEGPMGDWPSTPAGHQSFAESEGCTNEDRSCTDIPVFFGVHPVRSNLSRFVGCDVQ
eukprot:COSAG06_NODE_1303_length_9931_cov_69.878255_3_plen_110_part_00